MTPRALALVGALVACGDGRLPPAPTAPMPQGDAGRPPPLPLDAGSDGAPARDGPSPDVAPTVEQCNGRDDDGDGLVDELTCPEHFVCASTRECECGAIRRRCVNLCITLASHPLHCGACGNPCANLEDCVEGVCVPSCGAGTTRCGASCVDLTRTSEHCGMCGRRCGMGIPCEGGRCLAQEIFPPSGARLGTRRPELRWSAPSGATVCADARCERVVARLGDASSRSARVATPLAPGVYFWRAGDDRTPLPFRVDARDVAVSGALPPAPDLNADGLADIVVGCRGSVRVWLGRRGSLPDAADFSAPLPSFADPVLQVAGDFNGDGAGDAFAHVPGAELLTGGPSGRSPSLVPFGSSRGAPVGDLDGDGRGDWFTLVLPAEVRLGARSVALPVAHAPASPRGVAMLGDVNGDSYDDFAFGAPGASPPRAYLVVGSASASLRPAVFPPSSRSAGFGDTVATAGDVNGDGYADVLVGLGASGATLYLGGREGVSSPRALVGALGEELLVAAAGDVDADGFGDVLAVVRAGGEARLFRGGRDGLAATPVTLRDERWTAVEALGAPGDRDGDGFDDVVAGAPATGATHVLYGSATAPLTRAATVRGDALEECGRSVL